MNPALVVRLSMIAKEEGYPDMVIELSSGGNMAWVKGQKCEFNKISIGSYLKSNEQIAMFLHELAHFIHSREGGSGHDGRFADIFTALVAKYMRIL